jgi:hypothetical protein
MLFVQVNAVPVSAVCHLWAGTVLEYVTQLNPNTQQESTQEHHGKSLSCVNCRDDGDGAR